MSKMVKCDMCSGEVIGKGTFLVSYVKNGKHIMHQFDVCDSCGWYIMAWFQEQRA